MEVSSPPLHDPSPKSVSPFQDWLNIPSNSTSFPTASLVECLDPKAHIHDYWEQNTRPDGRLFSQGRSTKVVYGMLKHSAGSALVSQNDSRASRCGTKVMAATTFNVGQPSPEQPDEGEIVVQVSGTGGKSTGADSRSQQHQWDVLQSWLQRTLEQDATLAQSLNLLTGKACLRLVITVMIFEDNGNVKDTALLACMAAWKDTRLPIVGKDLVEAQGKLWWKQGTGAITSLASHDTIDNDAKAKSKGKGEQCNYRVSLTMGVWVNPIDQTTHLLADPSICEEPFLEGNLTMVVSLATEKLQVDYTGKVPLPATQIALAAKLARARAKEVATILS